MWNEFKKFIANDNIVQLATGLIMGSAFTAIVNSLVKDIFMPMIVALTSANDVSALSLKIGHTSIQYGSFLQAIINFFLIALFLYFTIKALERVQNKRIIKADDDKPKGPSEVELLTQILEELKHGSKEQ